MKTKLFFFIVFIAVSLNLTGQNDNYGIYWSDTSFDETYTRSIDAYAPFGNTFTPNGAFRVLIIYAGFYTPGVYDNEFVLLYQLGDISSQKAGKYLGRVQFILEERAAQKKIDTL